MQLQRAAIDDKSVPAAVVQIANEEIAKANPQLPPARQWVLTADLMNALNWPSLAAYALQNAESASPAIVRTPNVQFLSALVAANSGEKHVFANAETPVLDKQALATWSAKQPLVTAESAEVGGQVATSMQRIPSLKVFGLSLQGDLDYAKGNAAAARAAYTQAAAIRPTPSVSTRLQAVEPTGHAIREYAEPPRPAVQEAVIGNSSAASPAAAAQERAPESNTRRRADRAVVEQPSDH